MNAASVDIAHALPDGLIDELAALGALGVSIPERWGGSGLGLVGACAVVETLARHDRAVATTVGLHLGLGTRALVAFATNGQRDRWLPDLASGRRLGAFAATEPSAGSDLSRLATLARRDPATGKLMVSGQKSYVTNGALAGTFTVAVATEGLGDAQSGQNLLVLERDDGLVTGAEERKLGLRGSSTTPLYLDGVVVDQDRVIGPPGAGHRVLGQVLAYGRTAMAAGCSGTASAALRLAATHVAERHQFGRSLAAQPVVRAQLADMAAAVFAMRAIVAATVAVEGDVGGLERRSLAAKVFCSEADWSVCDQALQLHGGSGYLEESGAPLLLRDARITRIFEGANDVLLCRLGALELARPGDLHDDAPELTDVGTLASNLRASWLADDGLKVLRDPARLHQLGRLAVLREVAAAVAAHDGPSTDATENTRRHALSRLRHDAQALARALPARATIDHIVDPLLATVTP
ncbi:MAG: acyl-CoA dehydrogenase family protein [Deltaproteobacteria bacterium]|nr:acyl-CoA dehydrogenase family protein [Deltaproteobacteria bacterium]